MSARKTVETALAEPSEWKATMHFTGVIRGAAWFKVPDMKMTLDLPVHHQSISESGEPREFTVDGTGEYYLGNGWDTSRAVFCRQGSSVLALGIGSDGGIDSTYIFRVRSAR